MSMCMHINYACIHVAVFVCVCVCVCARARVPCAYKLYKGINQSFVDFFYLWAKPFKQVGRTFKRVIIFSPYR